MKTILTIAAFSALTTFTAGAYASVDPEVGTDAPIGPNNPVVQIGCYEAGGDTILVVDLKAKTMKVSDQSSSPIADGAYTQSAANGSLAFATAIDDGEETYTLTVPASVLASDMPVSATYTYSIIGDEAGPHTTDVKCSGYAAN